MQQEVEQEASTSRQVTWGTMHLTVGRFVWFFFPSPVINSSMLHFWILAISFSYVLFTCINHLYLFSHRPHAITNDLIPMSTALADAYLVGEVKKFHPLAEDLSISLS